MKVIAACGLLLVGFLSAAQASDLFADSVISYIIGAGGVNTGYNKPNAALGGLTSYATVVYPAYQKTDMVGVGLGGELTLGFNEPILNNPLNPYGLDFTVFGNEMFVLNSQGINGIYNHTGLTVWVSADNVNYYQLAAPYGADDRFPTTAKGDPTVPLNPSLTVANFQGLNYPGTATTAWPAPDLYNGSAGGASYDISWAEDAGGNPVDLSSISYVKIEGTTGYGYVDSVAAVQAVPEPSTFAMLLVGSGVAFYGIRRHRSSVSE